MRFFVIDFIHNLYYNFIIKGGFMEITFTRINFSIIGNCALFIKDNGQELRNIFKDYEVSTRDENLPDGTTATSLLFKKGAASLSAWIATL